MKRRSKIVCTLGPGTADRDLIRRLIEAGMNVARLNCSHGDWETKQQMVEWIRDMSPELAPVGILADLQGPKFRIGEVSGGVTEFMAGQSLTIGPDKGCDIPIFQADILAALTVGDRVLLGDGIVELKVTKETGSVHDARVVNGGMVRSKQGLTLVGKVFKTPSMTDKDKQDVYEACRLGVDYLALSYVKEAADMHELRRLVEKYDPDVRLCAKIETKEALKNIDEIVKASDLLMVARGDLGLQMDLEEVPLAQKKIIRRCNDAGKPVITATQMLESMIESPRPTRAEAADIANAILDGTDAVMLSGETAVGQFPVESVKTMARISERAESMIDYDGILQALGAKHAGRGEPTEAISHAVAQLAALLKPTAILTTTTSGQTSRLISKFRPRTSILAATWNKKTYTQLSVVWGIESLFVPIPQNTDEIVAHSIEGFMRQKRLKVKDTIIITSGVPAAKPGHTNLILCETVK